MGRALIKKSAVRASTFSIFIDNYLLMTRTRDAAAKSPLSKKHQLNKIGSSCFETLETGWPADRKNIPFSLFSFLSSFISKRAKFYPHLVFLSRGLSIHLLRSKVSKKRIGKSLSPQIYVSWLPLASFFVLFIIIRQGLTVLLERMCLSFFLSLC